MVTGGTCPCELCCLSGLKGARPVGKYRLGALCARWALVSAKPWSQASCLQETRRGVGGEPRGEGWEQQGAGLAWDLPEVSGQTLKAAEKQISGCRFLPLTCAFPGGPATAVGRLIMALDVGWGESKGLELSADWVCEILWLPPPTCKGALLIPIYR